MTKYTLIYFDAKGRAEVIRLIFAQAGVEYEDKRVDYAIQEQWAELKPKTPAGALPVLEVDGKMYPGSGPIARFVAERYGLAGTNDLENLEIAGIVDTIADCQQNLDNVMLAIFEKDETRKAKLMKKATEEHIPKHLGILEKLAADNNSAGGWLYGPKVTYADFSFFAACECIKRLGVAPNVFDKYPALKKLITSIENLPNIAKWLKERPATEY